MFVAAQEKAELLSTLQAYERMVKSCWPALHGDLTKRRQAWATMEAAQLSKELSSLMDECSTSPLAVRIFWKLVPGYAFRGGNGYFVQDSTVGSLEKAVGLTDFSPEVPWNRQAAHYRKDDEDVVTNAKDKLNIVERQDQAGGITTFLHTAKVPIFSATGERVGLMGGYRVVDNATAAKLMKAK